MDAQLPQDPHTSPLTVLEFFALPGAGKSTVVSAFGKKVIVTTRQDLTEQWANSSKLQRIAHVGRAFGNLRLLNAAVRFCLGARLYTRDSMFRLIRLVAKTEWLQSRSGLVLLDQGFLQDVWSILLSSKAARAEPELLHSLIRLLYDGIDVTIVVLEVDSKTASARVSGRTNGGSRFDNLPEGQLRSSIAASSGLQRQIVEAARLA
ncbi:MAG: hypothetical protein EOP84_36490, partial [Verrucomicrobiaceae bacterium]